MTEKDIIRLKHIKIVIFFLKNSLKLTFSNITYILKCNLKLIFLSQLQKIGILYYNQPKCIELK